MRSVSTCRTTRIWAVVVLLPFLSISAGCGHGAADVNQPSISYGTDGVTGPSAQLFTVPREQISHLRIVTVTVSSLPRVLRLTGSVAYNNFETTPIITQVGGPVSRILVSPGQIVRPRQVLLEIASPDYAQERTNYLKARDALSLAEKSYKRAQELYAHGAIPKADLEQAESTRDQAQADLQSAEQALTVLGISNLSALETTPSAHIPLLAPVGGEIVERLVSPGQVLQAGATQCFTISNMRSVWVLANVYQHDLAYVHVGDPVEIRTDAYPDVFRGRISYIAPALDPTTRTLQVRIVTENPGEKLKKDMYVTATVRAAVNRNAMTVPDAAVLRNAENEPFVYVALTDNQFAQRPVTLGEIQDGRAQITSGLRVGERVVADGSLFLQFANSLQR